MDTCERIMSSYPYGRQESITMVDQYAPMATAETAAVAAQWQPPVKDYSMPLHVDCSIEYELPDCAKPPQGVKVEPLLMIHPVYFRKLESLTRVPFVNNMPKASSVEQPSTSRGVRQQRGQAGPSRARPPPSAPPQQTAPRAVARRPQPPNTAMPPPEQVDFRQPSRRGRPPARQNKRYPTSNQSQQFHAQLMQSINRPPQYNQQINLQHGHQAAMQIMQTGSQQIHQPVPPQYLYQRSPQIESSMKLGSFMTPMSMQNAGQQVDPFSHQAQQQFVHQIVPHQQVVPHQLIAPQQLSQQMTQQQHPQEATLQQLLHQHSSPDVSSSMPRQPKTPTYADMVNICGPDLLMFIDELTTVTNERDRMRLLEDTLGYNAAHPEFDIEQMLFKDNMLAKTVAARNGIPAAPEYNVTQSNNASDYDIEQLLFKDKLNGKAATRNRNPEMAKDMQTYAEVDSMNNYVYNDDDIGMTFLMPNAMQQDVAQAVQNGGMMQDRTPALMSDYQRQAHALVKPLVANKHYAYSEQTGTNDCDNLSFTKIQGNLTTPPGFLPRLDIPQQQMNVFSM